jgi:hypothetical protein
VQLTPQFVGQRHPPEQHPAHRARTLPQVRAGRPGRLGRIRRDDDADRAGGRITRRVDEADDAAERTGRAAGRTDEGDGRPALELDPDARTLGDERLVARGRRQASSATMFTTMRRCSSSTVHACASWSVAASSSPAATSRESQSTGAISVPKSSVFTSAWTATGTASESSAPKAA